METVRKNQMGIIVNEKHGNRNYDCFWHAHQ